MLRYKTLYLPWFMCYIEWKSVRLEVLTNIVIFGGKTRTFSYCIEPLHVDVIRYTNDLIPCTLTQITTLQFRNYIFACLCVRKSDCIIKRLRTRLAAQMIPDFSPRNTMIDHSFLNLSYLRTFWVLNIPRYFYFALRLANYLHLCFPSYYSR